MGISKDVFKGEFTIFAGLSPFHSFLPIKVASPFCSP